MFPTKNLLSNILYPLICLSDLAGAISYLADYVKAAIFHLSERITELHDITSSIREELGIIRKQLDEGTVQSSNEQTNVPILFPGNSPSSLQSAPVVFPEENSSPHPCGGVGVWHPVAYYNMSDTRYLCPAGWTLHQPPARGCGRTTHKGHTCDSAVFPVHSGPYTKICGRVVGYQFGHTVAFLESNEHTAITINDSYVTGVSITRGSPRQHIWTYAAGFYERALSTPYKLYCPCEEVVRTTFIPPFVGTQWYCESGDNEQLGTPGRNLFPDDPLWDGRGCHRTSK